MKKILFIVLCLFLCPRGYSQSLKFNDLLNLYQKQNVKKFLIDNGFSPIERDADHIMYNKNTKTNIAERVLCNKKAISYTTPNPAFIQVIMKQLPKQFKLISKSTAETGTFLQFKRGRLTVTINLTQMPAAFNSISISKTK